jgi:hypothetical protein
MQTRIVREDDGYLLELRDPETGRGVGIPMTAEELDVIVGTWARVTVGAYLADRRGPKSGWEKVERMRASIDRRLADLRSE